MTRFLSLLIISLTVLSCKQSPKSASGKGVYEYLNDDSAQTRPPSPYFADKPATYARRGMVSSAHPEASKVGVEVLQAGGNAVDAAVAVHFALAVVHPAAGNLGGGGFVVFRQGDGKCFSLDFREKAPSSASRDMYLDETGNVIPDLSWEGHLSSGIPGSVDGVVQLHQRFGRLPWSALLEPAIRLAEEGVLLTKNEAGGLNRVREDFLKNNSSSTYLLADSVWHTGDRLVQKDLAQTLRRIKTQGRDGFYKGETAQMLLKEMGRGKGLITQADLDAYHSAWREPVTGHYKQYRIISMPPPSSGGVALLQLLKMVEPYPLRKWGWHADSTIQLMVEAERRVYADRSKFLGDPDFVKVPVRQLIDSGYLSKRLADFSFTAATPSEAVKGGRLPGYESTETTHFSIIDSEGNALAETTTLNNSFGSKVFVAGAGFLLNDEMDDFSVKPGVPNAFGLIGAEANAIQPNKRMLSSMTPTIVEEDGQVRMVVGTPGGSTIITSVFQTILNVTEHQMTMQQAVNALKFHHQWLPDKVLYERYAFSPAVVAQLLKKGYHLEELTGTLGRMDCILRKPDGQLESGTDPRADNTALGY